MIAINRGHNFTVFGTLIRNSPHDRQDFMGRGQQLFLAFAADTFKSIPAYGIPADCPDPANNQKTQPLEKTQRKPQIKFEGIWLNVSYQSCIIVIPRKREYILTFAGFGPVISFFGTPI